MKKQTLILVIGCHRSGTSAVTGALARMGVDVGTNLLGRAPDNPKGFYEDRDVVAAHETLLASANASWDHPPEKDFSFRPELLSYVRHQLRDVLRGMGPLCAIKDPRATLFVEMWKEICWDENVDLKLLVVKRHPEGILASLQAREGWSRKKAEAVLREYERATHSATHLAPFSVIHFPRDLWDEEAWRRVFRELRIDLEPRMEALEDFLDPDMIHHPPSGSDRRWTVVVPSKSDRKVVAFVESIRKAHPSMGLDQIVVVSDGLSGETAQKLWGVTWVDGRSPFVYPRAVNMGVAAAPSDSDLVICGDDIRFPLPGVLDRIHALSPGAAAIAPEIFGVCGQSAQRPSSSQPMADWLTFNCILIPRKVWNKVGEMDERFVGYGYDDVDWCIRAIEHGPLLIDHGSCVEHIDDSSFRSEPDWMERYKQNEELVKEKWSSRGVILQ